MNLVSNFVKNTFSGLFKRKGQYQASRSFVQDRHLMMKFLDDIDFGNFPSSCVTDTTIGVIVTPWMYTAVPWFAICTAVMLKYKGVHVVLIWDDLKYDDLVYRVSNSSLEQNNEIEKLLFQLKGLFTITKLSLMKDFELNEGDVQEVRALAKANTIHKFRTSLSSRNTKSFEEKWVQLQLNNFRKIRTYFSNCNLDQIIFPGGVYGNSGLYNYAAAAKNIHISTYDSGNLIAQICVNGIAGHLMDIPICFKKVEINQMNRFSLNLVEKLAEEELNLRMNGNDRLVSQIESFKDNNNEKQFDIIIPLNIAWDLAALRKHNYFENDYDWIIETVKFILEQTSASVAVRQHPHERRFESGKDFKAAITKNYGQSERFRFFGCDEPVNTYSIISKSKIVLPHTSTIGIEAALLGKSVIIESSSYYSNFGFVQKATSKSNYFDLIKDALEKPSNLNKTNSRDAWVCYYLTQICSMEETEFTAYADNFHIWVKKGFIHLMEDHSVQKIVNSFEERIPLALLNHRKIMKNNSLV